MMAAFRINFRILWKHIIVNFQVRHGQCDSIIFLKTFSLESSKELLLHLCLADSRILYFWQVLESIHKFKNKGGVGLFQISQKERLFISYNNQVLLGIISQCGPSSCTLSKKAFLFPSVWARREYIWKLNWKESLMISFENCQSVPCSHRQSRNRMMNNLITVNITPICKR